MTIAGSTAVLQYDCEVDGSTTWTELLFEDVLAIRYRDATACGEDDIVGFDYLVEEEIHGEFETLLTRWTFSVGWQAREKQKEAFKVYRVFFDDAAAVLVVARSVSVRSPISEVYRPPGT